MRAAAIKLIRAKGRYHTEIATKELAALYGIELKVYAEPDAIDQLRQVFECARRVLRNDGVDRARFDAAMIALDEACEAVKLHDSELADESKTDDEMRADFEAWYRKDVGAEGVFTFPGLDYDIDKYGGYRFYNVHRMWDAWKGHANQREQTA
jgi:uncharacterized Ntn-hydrolase superfamily protein